MWTHNSNHKAKGSEASDSGSLRCNCDDCYYVCYWKGPKRFPFSIPFPSFPMHQSWPKVWHTSIVTSKSSFVFHLPQQDFKPDQRTAQSSTPSPSLPKIHNIPTPPHAAQSPPTTCKKNNVSQIQFLIFDFNLAASMVTASLKQVTSLACSSDSSSEVSSLQALSSSGRSRAASPLS